jgi:hypothetical protein
VTLAEHSLCGDARLMVWRSAVVRIITAMVLSHSTMLIWLVVVAVVMAGMVTNMRLAMSTSTLAQRTEQCFSKRPRL